MFAGTTFAGAPFAGVMYAPTTPTPSSPKTGILPNWIRTFPDVSNLSAAIDGDDEEIAEIAGLWISRL
jgi:hypothetical protein